MKTETLNFAVGPVMMDEQTLAVAAKQIPYFRTEEFSSVVKACEANLKELFGASTFSKVVFMTGSGTASMEATIMNVLRVGDCALVVNGGAFGERFCKICDVHGIAYTAVECERGRTLSPERLFSMDGSKYTAFVVNLCETSTGVLYDIEAISAFCKRYGLLLIVDAVSAFLCDGFDMRAHGIDAVITGSQKALALAPGLSVTCLSERAVARVEANDVKSLYFNFKDYFLDGERGQTPFTPAVGIINQLKEKTDRIIACGGIDYAVERAKMNAQYFRKAIEGLSIRLYADNPSNSVTAIEVRGDVDAYDVFLTLKNEYGIFVCPNGGELKNNVFRVGHMGNITFSDYDRLVEALREVLGGRRLHRRNQCGEGKTNG